MNMSFEEKSAWVSLVLILAIFGHYFMKLVGLSEMELEVARNFAVQSLSSAMIMIVVLEAVLHAVMAATNRKGEGVEADERDKLISYKANQWGYTVLVIGVVLCIGWMLLVELKPELADFERSVTVPFMTAHILMFSFILSEVVRFSGQVFFYRRGY